MTLPTTYQKIVLFLFLLCLPIGAAIYAYILISDTWHQIDIVTYLKGDGYMFIILKTAVKPPSYSNFRA